MSKTPDCLSSRMEDSLRISVTNMKASPNVSDKPKQEPLENKFEIFELESDDENIKNLSPIEFERSISIRDPDKGKERRRRFRVPYSAQEVLNLRHGVASMGTRWQQILNTYQFHSSRTAVDLKEKFKRVMDSKKTPHNKSQEVNLPFSRCEIQRLARGVRMFGHNWTAILAGERFLPGRTAENLRLKWRSIMRKQL